MHDVYAAHAASWPACDAGPQTSAPTQKNAAENGASSSDGTGDATVKMNVRKVTFQDLNDTI